MVWGAGSIDEAGTSGYDTTSLFWEAASEGNLELLKQCAAELHTGGRLVETFARVRDDRGRTALHVAAAAGKRDICVYLIEEIDVGVDFIDDKCRSPLHYAVLHNRFGTAVYLLSVGACSSLCDYRAYTPLHYAAEIGHVPMLRLLIAVGAGIDLVSDYGTPLQRAIAYRRKDAVEVLLDYEADPDFAACEFFTPLLCSIFANSFDCLEVLLKAGADPNISGGGMNCMTPLGQAAANGATRLVDCLLSFGADPDAVDNSGLTPLEWAVLNRHDEALRILFPVTAQISYYPEWSISGIMNHIHPEEATTHVRIMSFTIQIAFVIFPPKEFYHLLSEIYCINANLRFAMLVSRIKI
ncbi:ankyrin repeat, PH and SEC7 domain containing protein secG-like isoform X1 [Sesamum indicum]|uniref:Ankyrin repeat, PH and SEC7 domain containing protein secG-like isoform X1 n=1 Tax=Sesamum indicum TaxID=4182 RepID=A0A8M8UT97_SESIN|nr:ankyrin repeat, PH and SEC7 domain containing protein secG-like isoform X1 [Sesamum indicum]